MACQRAANIASVPSATSSKWKHGASLRRVNFTHAENSL
jgi:hypothetical protein